MLCGLGLLDGKVVIITGAARGIGREEALGLAAEGAQIIVGDVDREAGESVIEEITSVNGAATLHVGDCADVESAKELIRTAIESFGNLDALVNNAGILRDRTLSNMTVDEWDDVIRVNLRGHYAPTRAAINHWRTVDQPGRIVCTTSTSGILGNFGQSNYGAAKAGVAAFAQIVALENWSHGITVNTICPAARTRLSEGAYGSINPADNDFDFWSPENIAPFVAFLCSEASSHISGKVFGVQGDTIELYRPWTSAAVIENHGARWDPTAIAGRIDTLFQETGMSASVENGMTRLRRSMIKRP